LFYGNTLFEPVVLATAFGPSETVQKTAADTVLVAAMALPGYFFSVFAVGRQSPKFIQIQGFFLMGILYLVVGTLYDLLARDRTALLILYGSTFLFSNYGPNATTFMLPSLTFSKTCRSTLNGICAACGKAGALVGAVLFVRAAAAYGQKAVFLACGVLSFVGCLITLLCVSDQVSEKRDEIEKHSADRSLIDMQEELAFEARTTRVSMKVVYSNPSLMDLRE